MESASVRSIEIGFSCLWMVLQLLYPVCVENSACSAKIHDPQNGTLYFIANRVRSHPKESINDFRIVYSWDCRNVCVQASFEFNGKDFKGEENCGAGYTNVLVMDGIFGQMILEGENVIALHLDLISEAAEAVHLASAWSEFTVRILPAPRHDLIPAEPPVVSTRMGRLRAEPAAYLHSIMSWVAPLMQPAAISPLMFEVPFNDDVTIDVVAKVGRRALAHSVARTGGSLAHI